jgi:ribbon-helix-helix CopG family protein
LIVYKFPKDHEMAKKKHGGKRAGAGRKASPEGPAIVVAASVPESLVVSLDELTERLQWNRSKAIAEAIRLLVKAKRRA